MSNSNNKLIYTWNKAGKHISPDTLSSYAESIIFDGDKRTIWYKGKQFGNTYYGSNWSETFNDVQNNTAIGAYSHAEGSYNNVTGDYSHAEGLYNTTAGNMSSVQGSYNHAGYKKDREIHNNAHAEGTYTKAYGEASHAEGYNTRVNSDANYGHAEGNNTLVNTGFSGHAEGYKTIVNSNYAHTEGQTTFANGYASHAEGLSSYTNAQASHAEGYNSYANGNYSHSEGIGSYAKGAASHAEGNRTIANNLYSHAEGSYTYAYGLYSHTEGYGSYTIGVGSHAEGYNTYAIGNYSHSNGTNTSAQADNTFTSGIGTIASRNNCAAFGRYNSYNDNAGGTIFAIGDGWSDTKRHSIIDVQEDMTYISNQSYFGNYVYAPLTYSYVDYTGSDKRLDLLIKALLDEAEYTRPTFYTKFENIHQTTNYQPSYITASDATMKVEMEIGSYFKPSLTIYWPSVDENIEIASRMSSRDIDGVDYNSYPPYRYGYSYGPYGNKPLNFYYNYCDDWSLSHTDAETLYNSAFDLNLPATTIEAPGYTYITGEDDYTTIRDITFSYKESSYMIYSQLKKVGLTQISYGGNSACFGANTTKIPQKLIVCGRYKWYCGFSDTVPNEKSNMEANSGFLKKNYNISDIYTTCEYAITKEDMKKKIFWCACPKEFTLVQYNNGYQNYNINICRGNAVNFDLVSDVQPINTTTVYIPLGYGIYQPTGSMALHEYTIYYVTFEQWSLGDGDNDVVKFRFMRR